ncbi:hypothetical protein [Streptomyces sp. NPDC007355]
MPHGLRRGQPIPLLVEVRGVVREGVHELLDTVACLAYSFILGAQ